MELTAPQNIAIKNVSEYISKRKNKYIDMIEMILHQANIDVEVYQEYCKNVKKYSQIALHFHPDRIFSEGFNVIDGMLKSGKYKNQFETNISSGSVTAFSGGNRDNWEKDIFSDAYQFAKPSERPKYGSLNLTMTEDGSSPRFGSCYFLVKPEVKERATFTYGDTYESPRELGTIDNFELINAAILKDLFTRGTALGEKDTNVNDFLKLTNRLLPQTLDSRDYRRASKNLDFYIEAQIHGDISLYNDIDSLVVEFSYWGTDMAIQFEALCAKYDIELIWNSGRELKVSEFPNNFRGAEVPSYAKKLGVDGKLNAFLIGKAATQMNNEHDNLQMLKYLWHCIVKFGTEINMSTSNK
ncbi:DUF3626 domain-containing protein [Saccharicrinis aurantiacus]|uniref:DUF3626 domain-containing protein n=1 Tax=Saccharicrinis aurantiacus TaxID=1849719 RepID=UPI00248FBF5E|nr:DUF3626 domain-containing protein [Saccharicrinis aurantiacus]